MPTRPNAFRASVTIFAAVLAACAPEDRNASPASDTAGNVRGTASPDSGSQPVTEIMAPDGPESVRYDPAQDAYLISTVGGYGSTRDNNGAILRVDAGDVSRVLTLAKGGKNGVTLDAPKGLALHGDTLWVADIDVLRAFDRRNGAPLATVDFRPLHAVQLNDVAIGPDGNIYVTDTGIDMTEWGVIHRGGDRIYSVGPGRAISAIGKVGPITFPNGLTWDARNGRWLVVTFDPFESKLYALGRNDSTPTLLASGKGRFDGVEVLDDGRILVTAWNDSSVHAITPDGDARIVRDLTDPADLGVDTRRGVMAVPLLTMGKVQLWTLPGRRPAPARLATR
ncbi:MAG TPA: SMP-30/gluconolactonase/LRE family protein [Gemmatimonadaceae bacterium]|nr:SMP-30/gluconolactonase/LRE family protein [Gemmatimonadaceae bacterium]